jgi:hypothetical protein
VGIQNQFLVDGSLDKFKAFLVAGVFSQVKGFSPITKMESICLLLSLTSSQAWEAHHMYVKSAFLHEELNE